jgi:hypothetical protein
MLSDPLDTCQKDKTKRTESEKRTSWTENENADEEKNGV